MTTFLLRREGDQIAISLRAIGDPAVGVIKRAPQKGTWRGATWLCPATKRTLEYFQGKGQWTKEAEELLESLHVLSVTAAPARENLDFKFKTKPYDHQLDIFKKSRAFKAAAYFMEQRTGKSKVCIDKAASHFARNEIDAMIVLAWPNGVHVNWVDQELPAHMPDWAPYRACAWSSKRANSKTWQRENLLPVMTPTPGTLAILTANSDGLIGKKLFETLEDFIELYAGRVLIVFDECTYFSKPGTKGSKLARKLAGRCAYRVIATGTPGDRNPLAYYSMFNLCDPTIFGYESFNSFRSRYAVMEPLWGKKSKWGRQIEVVKGYQNLDELKAKVDPISFRVLLDEVSDMPARIYQRIYSELTPKQSRIYESLAEEFKAELSEGVTMTSAMALTRIMRLHQICLNLFKPDGEGVEALPIEEGVHPRLTAARDWCSLASGKVIVWATFRHSLQELVDTLDKDGGAVGFWGTHSDTERQDNLKRWKRESSCKHIVGHPRALGYGYRLTEANTTLYYANGYSLEARNQTEARPEAIGQTRSNLYGDVEAEGTVETEIIQALRDKKQIAAILTGDKLKDWI